MAQLLYRLGRFAARNPLRVLGFWILALATAVVAFLTAGGTLASTFSIPGTQTAAVTAQLAQKLPNLAGVAGTVVFQTKDGEPFTAEQRNGVSDLLAGLKGHDRVRDVVDPFTVQQQLSDQRKQLADGQKQVDDGKAQIAAGRQQIAAAQQQLTAAKTAAAGNPAALAQINQQQAQLDAQTKQLDAGEAQIATKSKPLEQGRQLLDFSSRIRTVSTDGTTATGVVMFSDDQFSLPQEAKDSVAHKLDAAAIPGVTVDYSSEIAQSTNGLMGPGEITGLIVAALVLLLMLRTLLATVLPLISSLIGVGVGVAGAMAFSGVVDMASVTPVLGLMLGLAVGIDYSLFIVNRHRRQLRAGMDVHESIGLANGTAGGAVVFAGATVIVALLALNVTGIPFLERDGRRRRGLRGRRRAGRDHAAGGAAADGRAAPAHQADAGRDRQGRARRGCPEADADLARHRDGVAGDRGPAGGRRARAVDAAGPARRLRPGHGLHPYRTFKTVADKFGTGVNGPLLITAQTPKPVAADDVLATQVDIARVLMPAAGRGRGRPGGGGRQQGLLCLPGGSGRRPDQCVHRGPGGPAACAADAARRHHARRRRLASANIDVSDKLSDALPVYLIVVVGLSLLIMIVVFRSLLVPLIATAGYVLSLFAAFGVVVAVYQWGWLATVFGVHDPGPVLDFAPIILMGVLFGLAMDYQLFLVSRGCARRTCTACRPARPSPPACATGGPWSPRPRSSWWRSSAASSSRTGPGPAARLGLAVGVLFDAFVVRMLLVPALMHLTGQAVWWLPRWLDRLLPNVDVEGAALERSHPLPGAERVVEKERETGVELTPEPGAGPWRRGPASAQLQHLVAQAVRVRAGQHDRAALGDETLQHQPNRQRGLVVGVTEGLVEHQQRGAAQQGAGQHQAAAHPRREVRDPGDGLVGQAGQREQVPGPDHHFLGSSPLAALVSSPRRQVAPRPAAVQRRVGHRPDHPLPVLPQVDVEHADDALVRRQHPRHHGQHRRLAAAGQAGDGPGAHLEGDVVHHDLVAELLAQPGDLGRGGSGGAGSERGERRHLGEHGLTSENPSSLVRSTLATRPRRHIGKIPRTGPEGLNPTPWSEAEPPLHLSGVRVAPLTPVQAQRLLPQRAGLVVLAEGGVRGT